MSSLAPPKSRQKKKSSHPRQSSGVYNTFSAKQIQGFKEAFSMIDQDSDGLIKRKDLKVMLENLGQPADDAIIESYFESAIMAGGAGEAEQAINFTQFLTMFGEHLSEVGPRLETTTLYMLPMYCVSHTSVPLHLHCLLAQMDEAPTLLDAFECFDEKDDGVIDAAEMRYWLSEVGDRMTDEEVSLDREVGRFR